MDAEDLPSWAQSLLRDARVAHLGILDSDDRPRVLPVTFAWHAGRVYTAVDYKPKRVQARELARVRFLRRRPQAAITVDRYDDDWTRLAWVQLLGDVEVLEAGADPAALAALRAKYEPYRRAAPSGPLLRMTPARVLCWCAGMYTRPRS